jgi:hypothetical protein
MKSQKLKEAKKLLMFTIDRKRWSARSFAEKDSISSDLNNVRSRMWHSARDLSAWIILRFTQR